MRATNPQLLSKSYQQGVNICNYLKHIILRWVKRLTHKIYLRSYRSDNEHRHISKIHRRNYPHNVNNTYQTSPLSMISHQREERKRKILFFGIRLVVTLWRFRYFSSLGVFTARWEEDCPAGVTLFFVRREPGQRDQRIRRVVRYEENVPASQEETKKHARFSGAHGDKERKKSPFSSPRQGPLEAHGKRREISEFSATRSARTRRVQSCVRLGSAN
jgi:hypothetical protein